MIRFGREPGQDRPPVFEVKAPVTPQEILTFSREGLAKNPPLGVMREAVQNIAAILLDTRGLRQYEDTVQGDLMLARHKIQAEIDRLDELRGASNS